MAKRKSAKAPAEGAGQLEGRTLENTFTELEREGKACLYELLRATVDKMPRTYFTPERRRWNGALNDERGDLLNGFRRDGGTAVYGHTFQRAKARWDAEVKAAPPRQLSEEERRWVIDVPPDPSTPDVPGGTIYIGAAPERGSTVPLETLFTYWIEEFTAEVKKAVEAFRENPGTSTELQRITNALRSFEVGAKGRLILQPMQADAAGSDLLEKFEHAKSRLALGLEEVAPVHAAEMTNAAPANVERIEWNDTAALLAYLLTELIEADYIIPPPNGRKTGKEGNRAAVADMVFRLFDIRDRATGNPVTREYFRSLMRPSSSDRDSRPDLFRIRSRTARNEPT